jgi:hypothetical protein
METRKLWKTIFKILKENKRNLSTYNLYPVQILFKNEGNIMTFLGKRKLLEFSRPTVLVWILNVFQRLILKAWSPVTLLGGGRIFRRWGLVGGS